MIGQGTAIMRLHRASGDAALAFIGATTDEVTVP